MTDFLFSSRRRQPGTLRSTLEPFVGAAAASIVERDARFGSLAVALPPHQRDALVSEEGKLTVLAGIPIVREDREGGERTRAAGPGRMAVHRLLQDPKVEDWSEWLDGSFAGLFLEEGGTGRLVTDLFGWVPVFASDVNDGGLVIGTHPDALAAAAGRGGDVDPVAVIELILFQQVTWPGTLFRGVTQVAPASERRIGPDGRWAGPARTYWEPGEANPYGSPADAAEALRAAFVADVHGACAGQDRVGVLLSGGEDSRVVLGALPEGVAAEGFTLAPSENREVRAARRAGKAYGARVTWGERPEGHDLRHFETVAALVGSGHHFADLHTYPFHRTLGLDALPVVLGGFSSDALLKGDNVSRSARRHGPGYRGPITAPAAPGLRPELVEAALARRRAHLERVAALRPDSADEWFHIWPFTMRRYAAHHLGNRRLFPVHEPFQSNDVVRIAAAVPQEWKLDRRLFTAAFRPLLRPSWYLPHARNRLPYFGAGVNRVVRGPLGLVRRIRERAAGERGANQESWPVWPRVVASDAMAEALRRNPPLESAVADVVVPGIDADGLERERVRWPAMSQLALLQLSHLLARGAR